MNRLNPFSNSTVASFFIKRQLENAEAMDSIVKYLQALDLKPGASLEEIKQTYRELVKVWHPDRFQNENEHLQKRAQEKLKEINLAYEKLREHCENGGTTHSKTKSSSEQPQTPPQPTASPRPQDSKVQLDGVECPRCERKVIPLFFRNRRSSLHLDRIQQVCPHCERVLEETGGGLQLETKILVACILLILGFISIHSGFSSFANWFSDMMTHENIPMLVIHQKVDSQEPEKPPQELPRQPLPSPEPLKLFGKGRFPKGIVYSVGDLKKLRDQNLENTWLQGEFIVKNHIQSNLYLRPYRISQSPSMKDLLNTIGLEDDILVVCKIPYPLPVSMIHYAFTANLDQPLELLSVSYEQGHWFAFTRLRTSLSIEGVRYPSESPLEDNKIPH